MKLKLVLTLISCIISWHVCNAQSILSGTIYDAASKLPLSAVLIRSNKKQAVIADRSGNFKIQASENDLLIFTLAGYQPDTLYLIDLTPKKVELTSTTHLLNEVKISANSTEETFNPRKEYPEVYEKSKFALAPSRLFGKDSRNARRLKRYFENEAKQRKIDSLFNKRLVGAIIPLKGTELRNFMSKYRPTLSFLTKSSPDQLSVYIKERYQEFLELPTQQQGLPPLH
jgi:hypothetical protein